jgi:hypothetical protein
MKRLGTGIVRGALIVGWGAIKVTCQKARVLVVLLQPLLYNRCVTLASKYTP